MILQICKSVQRFWRYAVIKNITYIQDTREKHNPSLAAGNKNIKLFPGMSCRVGKKKYKHSFEWHLNPRLFYVLRNILSERNFMTIIFFIFPFLRSGVEIKRGVELCHSTLNASRIRQKVGNRSVNSRFPLSTLLWAEYSVNLIKI